MSLPVLAKTWQFQVNQTVAAQGSALNTSRRLLRTIKNLLTGFALQPWAVRGSSDSSTAGMDQVDRWAADANLVGNSPGSVHAWIVLRQTGIATNFEACIDITSSSNSLFTLIVSPSAGFTGGSTTNRPTATDEIVVQTSYAWWSQLDAQHQVHAMQSSDGQCTRVMVWRGGTNMCTFLLLDKPKNPVTGWTNPSVAWLLGAGSGYAATYAILSTQLTTAQGKGKGASAMALFMTGEGANSSVTGLSAADAVTLGAQANDLSSEWPFWPIGMASITTANKGRHGQHFDLWWKPTAVNDGDTFPNNAATRQFAAFANLIFPWVGDSTTPLLT